MMCYTTWVGGEGLVMIGPDMVLVMSLVGYPSLKWKIYILGFKGVSLWWRGVWWVTLEMIIFNRQTARQTIPHAPTDKLWQTWGGGGANQAAGLTRYLYSGDLNPGVRHSDLHCTWQQLAEHLKARQKSGFLGGFTVLWHWRSRLPDLLKF